MQQAVAQILAAAEDSKQAMTMAAEAARQATTAAHASTAAANAATSAVHQIGSELRTLRRDFSVLWSRVVGSHPPPPPGDAHAAPVEVHGDPPLVEQIDIVSETASQASLEVAAVEGRMINYVSAFERRVMGELAKQSKDMGVDRTGWSFLRTKQGRTQAVAVLTFITAAAGALAGAWRSPSPAPAAPAPTIIYAPPPAASR